MVRRAHKIDDNQPEVVKCFRDFGCHVAITSMLGEGFPDIVVSWNGFTVLVEIKDGAKPPSRRALTLDEQLFAAEFQGWYEVIQCEADCIKLFQRLRKRYFNRLKDTDTGRDERRVTGSGPST